MSPDKRARARSRKPKVAEPAPVQVRPSADDVHEIVYFRRAADGWMPAREYQRSLPTSVRTKFANVLIAVAKAPPNKFAGGGYWEAMHGDMTGWFEVRCDYRNMHCRLFCRLDYEAAGRNKPLLAVIAGLSKPRGTLLSEDDYADVRKLGEEYFSTNPRSTG